MQPEAYRQASHAVWEAMAPGWEQRRDWLRELSIPVTAWMVERLDPQPGETVLELAAGLGDTGFVAAERLGREGRLISSDFASEMVDGARRRAVELGVENADFRVIDAERIELADASVDGVLCRWGYMLMAEPEAALGETRRVLRPEGRLACSVFGAPERNLWASAAGRLLAERGHLPPPAPGRPGIFGIPTRERLEALLRAAGFDAVAIEEVEMRFSFADLEDFWDFLMRFAGALSMVISKLPEREQEELRAQLAERLAPTRAGGTGYEMSAVCLNALAR